jgi:iron complex outermembrane receptor protein
MRNHYGRAGRFALAALSLTLSQVSHAADEPAVQPHDNQSTATPGQDQNPPAEQTMPEMEIKASKEGPNYVVPNATTATKTDTPLMETPASVQVIPQQVLQDQKTTSLDQALSNASGVVTTGTDDIQEGVTIRGFYTSQTLRDGVLVSEYSTTGGGTVGAVNMTDVQSVEVLKGPGAILYGRLEPGGIVNITKKQPLDQFYGSVEQLVGSWDHYRTSVDLTGPLNESKTLLYRLNVSYDQSDSWRNNVYNKTSFLAPVLEWRVNPQTTIWLEGEYGHENMKYDMQIVPINPATNTLDTTFPRNVNFMDNPATYDTSMTAIKWEHKFNDDWSIKHQLVHNQTIVPAASDYYPYGCDNATPQNCGMYQVGGVWYDVRTLYYGGSTMKSDSTILDVTGNFDSYGIKHKLLFGGDYSLENFSFIQGGNYSPTAFDTTDAANPTTPNIPVDPTTVSTQDFGLMKQWGVYVQDQAKLPGNVTVLAGLRDQWYVTKGTNGRADQFDTATTPRLGAVWQQHDWLSWYGSYSGGFGNNNGYDWQGRPLPPENAKQYELGTKTEFYGGKLTSTLALFDLTKTNMLIADLNHPDPSCAGCFFSKVGGDINSRGVEFDIQGEIFPGWDAIANYTFDRAMVVNTTPGSSLILGDRQANTPEHMVNAWSTYRLRQENLLGWKVGGGFNWHASSVDQSNVYTNPAFIVWNAMASYEFKIGKEKLTTQLNVKNLFNKEYYDNINYPSGTYTWVTYGNPRSYTATVKVEF